MLNVNEYILLFECCQLTKGQSRTLLVDLQRNKLEFLDNEIFLIFSGKNRRKTIKDILKGYPKETGEIVLEYLEFLITNEYAFTCSKQELNQFSKLPLNWENPALITNCIIDFDKIPENIDSYLKLITDLDELGCENIQIRDYFGLPISFLESFLDHFNPTVLYRIELLLKFTDSLENYRKFLDKFPRINALILHSSDSEISIETDKLQKVTLTKQVVENESCCGVVSAGYFNLTMSHFLESLNFNSCLNRKLSVDRNGEIKNCPSLKKSYGSITTISIKDVIKTKEFTAVWKIKKDSIATCKICEFRHICTDCRAYLKNDNSKEKPKNCSYDPVSMSWE